MSKQAFDRKLAEVEALRGAPEEDAMTALRKALRDRNNYVCGKAARVTGDRALTALVPDLLDAFTRFLRDPVKTDPQCWAKNAIAKTLKDLGHNEPRAFLQGVEHFQLEPVWGGTQDTATTLRATCALALIGCAIDTVELVKKLVDLLVDPAVPVRIDACRALGQLAANEAQLALRLKALVGDEAPEVTGQCLAVLLQLDAEEYVPFVQKFLNHKEPDLRLEAAGALAESGAAGALEAVEEFWGRQTDAVLKHSILTFLSASPRPEAAEFLLRLMASENDGTAAEALRVLAKTRFWLASKERAGQIVRERGSGERQAVWETL